MTDERDHGPNASSADDQAAGSGVSAGIGPEGEDRSLLAAEYALGTLDPDDRANAQMLMAIDPGFSAAVADWERRLGELHALVNPVEPPKDTWDWIKARIATSAPSGAVWLPTAEEAAAPAPPARGAALPFEEPGPTVVSLDLWRGRVKRWQTLTAGCGALAAALVALMVVRDVRPEILPRQLQPTPMVVEKPVEVVRTVEVVREVPSPRIAEFVAVLQKDAGSPAFVLTIDLQRRTLSVRRVGAEEQPGKDYELWLVSNKFPAPRSLGVVGDREFTVRRGLNDYDAPTLNAATYAVSLEPLGGSPSGAPTGPVLFTGKLLQTTPAAFPATP